MGLFEIASSREEAMYIANMARQVASRLPPELVAKIMNPSIASASGTREKGFEAYLTLADDVSRESRTYDTNSSGFIDMLMDTQLTKAQEELLVNLQRSLAYSSRVLQNSILYFKADSGILVMDMATTFEIQHIFDKALMENRQLENNMNVNVIRRVEKGFPALMGDITYLSAIIENLVDNSAKFTIQGSVTLSARVLDRPTIGKDAGTALVEFSVTDTGCGIPAAQLPILKIPFSTKNEAFWSAQDTKGAGLGIPTADCLARSFPEGRIDIDTVEGAGTSVKFRCRLKIDPSVECDMFGLEPPSLDGSQKPIKIAVCAPEPTFTTISGMLAPHGFELKHVTSRMATADIWFDVKQASLQNEPFRCALIDALSQSAAPHHSQLVYSLASQLKSEPLTKNIQTAIMIHAGYFAHDSTKGENFNEGILKPLLYRQVTSIVKRMIGHSDGSNAVFDMRALTTSMVDLDYDIHSDSFYDHHVGSSAASSSGGLMNGLGGTNSQRSSTHSLTIPSSLSAARKRRLSVPDMNASLFRDSMQAIADGSSSSSSTSALAELPESPVSSPRGGTFSDHSLSDLSYPASAMLRTRGRRSHTNVDASSMAAFQAFVHGTTAASGPIAGVGASSGSSLSLSGGLPMLNSTAAAMANANFMPGPGSVVGAFGANTHGPLPPNEFLKLTVLVVEDETLNRLVLKQMIHTSGHLALTAENGQTGVSMYQKHHDTIDVIIMDYRMPHMDGLQATAAIRAFEEENQLPRTDIIALTADDSVRSKCLSAGMDDCWTKPVRLQVLQATLLQKCVSKESLHPPSHPGTPTPGNTSLIQSPQSTSNPTIANNRHSAPMPYAVSFYHQQPQNSHPGPDDISALQSALVPASHFTINSHITATREYRTRSDPVLTSDEAALIAVSHSVSGAPDIIVPSSPSHPASTLAQSDGATGKQNPLRLPPIPSKKPSNGSIGGEGGSVISPLLESLPDAVSDPNAATPNSIITPATPPLVPPSAPNHSSVSVMELASSSPTPVPTLSEGSSTGTSSSTSSGAPGTPTASGNRVPVSRGSRKALVPASNSSPGTSRDCILLVEDNTTVAKIATTVLERNHQKVEHVADGQEAFEKISREHGSFDIVLMDIHLPKLGGFECTALIRDFEKQHNLLPLYIIALTGDRHVDTEKYLSKGFNYFLRKPLNYPSLISELPSIREQHSAQFYPSSEPPSPSSNSSIVASSSGSNVSKQQKSEI
jgi:CheY-like chemotaxis protein/signal transduction histidine kinase